MMLHLRTMIFHLRIIRFHLRLRLQLPIQNNSLYTIRGKSYPYHLTMEFARKNYDEAESRVDGGSLFGSTGGKSHGHPTN
eukprot:4257246-Karenia_brevis.AAC.1